MNNDIRFFNEIIGGGGSNANSSNGWLVFAIVCGALAIVLCIIMVAKMVNKARYCEISLEQDYIKGKCFVGPIDKDAVGVPFMDFHLKLDEITGVSVRASGYWLDIVAGATKYQVYTSDATNLAAQIQNAIFQRKQS